MSYFMLNLNNGNSHINNSIATINNREELLGILEKSKINNKNILAINALRAYMKYSSKMNKKKITHYISAILEIS